MIDWSRLAELREEIGADDLADVVALFLDEADEVVAGISGGLPDSGLEGQLHFLKGSALNLGLSDLAAICQEGERQSAQGLGATVDRAAIVSIYQTSKTAFLGALDQSSAA